MSGSLREALIVSGTLAPKIAPEVPRGGMILGQDGNPRLGDIRATYVQNPLKNGHKNSEGKLTPPKKEQIIMSNTTENKSVETAPKSSAKSAKSDAELGAIAMESLNKSIETHVMVGALNESIDALVKSNNAVVLALTEEAKSVINSNDQQLLASKEVNAAMLKSIEERAHTMQHELETLRIAVQNPRVVAKRDTVGDIGLVLGAIGGGVAVHHFFKTEEVTPDASAMVGGVLVGALAGAAAARVTDNAGSAALGWFRARRAKKEEAAKLTPPPAK